MKPALEELLRHPGVWRAQRAREALPASRCLSSGDAALDAWLPNGGWPCGALTELLCEHRGIGEFSLLLPLLARVTAAGGRVALIAPPLLPYAPALSAAGVSLERLLLIRPRLPIEAPWAAEQLLRSGLYGVVLLWSTRQPSARALRRLQLAAEHGEASIFVFRAGQRQEPLAGLPDRPPSASAGQPRAASPAALRLQVSPCGERVRAAARDGCRPRLLLGVLKCRGRAPNAPLAL